MKVVEENESEDEDKEEEKVEFKGVVVEELIEKEVVPENLKDDFDKDGKDEDGNFIVKEEDTEKEESKHELFLGMAEMFQSLTAQSVEIEDPANETLYKLPTLFAQFGSKGQFEDFTLTVDFTDPEELGQFVKLDLKKGAVVIGPFKEDSIEENEVAVVTLRIA